MHRGGLTALLLLGATAAPPTPVARQAPAPTEVTITGTDYAFQVPRHVRAGASVFGFENHGKVRHEMVIILLRQGITADSAARGLEAGVRRRDLVEGEAALIVAAPGEGPGPRLWFDLQRGRSYLVMCNLTDGPGKPRHMTLGMYGGFIPE